MDSGSELLTVREAARRLGVHENTVRAYAKQGLLPDARVPGTRFYKFRASDVERLIAQRGAPAPSLAAERQTANPELVTASQLAYWPVTRARDAQSHFPGLVRRLLQETPGAGQISIRTGDGVGLAGNDGVAVLEGRSKLLPAGPIRFEFGTDKDCKKKATKDYNDRKKTASGDETFVFATPRRWQGKDVWASGRRAEDLFKDVLVLDADDLEAWLQLAPSAHFWISEHLGLRPRNAITLETWWARFGASTEPILPAKLFTAGREPQSQQLRSLLIGEPRLISIETEWTDDALGFVATTTLAQANRDNVDMPSPIVVDAAVAWDRIVSVPGNGTLIPLFEKADVDRAISGGRRVVAIFDRTTARRRSVDMKLPRVGRVEAADAFRSVGTDWHRADRLAVLARRSMPALARNLSRSPRVQQPAWSKPPLAGTLAALMLASRWTDRPEDLQILSDLAGVPLADLRRSTREASHGPDPAIRNVRDAWVFASLEEAFLQLGSRVSSDLADRWADLATSILLDPDPFAGLTSGERLAAQMKGLRRTYSSTLRRGIADSLALAGAIESTPEDANEASSVVGRVVRDVLRQATADLGGGTWSAIADVLPLLAEAAPDTFLSALEDDLLAAEPTVGHLFRSMDDPHSLGPSTLQHHVLWALEVVCWSPEHLVHATQILARLCQYQMPKSSGNTPLESLATILCGWVRNTGADLATRLDALGACRIVSRATAWDLLKELWPDSHAWISPPHAPRYQLWKPNSSVVSSGEWISFTASLTDRAIEWAKQDRDETPWLVEALTKVGTEDAERIINFLEETAGDAGLAEDVRLSLFERARDVAARHERFETSDWAVPAATRARLSALADLLQPDDLRRFAYLFGWRPDLPSGDHGNFERYTTELEDKRREAIDVILAQPDAWKQLAAVAERAEAPTQIGWALAPYDRADALDVVLGWLASESRALQEAGATWVRRHLAIYGPVDLRRALDRSDVTNKGLELLVLNVPHSSQFWDVLHEFPSAEALYWTSANMDVLPRKDVTRAIETLLGHERAWAAIAVASYGIHEPITDETGQLPDSELILSILRSAITQDPGAADISQMTGHYVGTLLDHLASAGATLGDLASLEFAFFRLLQHTREPQALNQMLASDPRQFVILVSRAYRGASEARRRNREADPSAEHAFSILNGWYGFPGQQPDGTLDDDAMQEWVRQARLELSDLDRADIGDELIGNSFAHAPAGADGVWPPEEIRNLLESIGSRNFENGITNGRLNSRGVTMRGVYDGGGQERKLAAQYKEWSSNVQARWPRSGRILRAIAESYEKRAIEEDQEAQVDQDFD